MRLRVSFLSLIGSNVSPTINVPACPRCGKDLLSSKVYPRGTSAEGVYYVAKACRNQGLWFGKAPDGSWTVPLRPLNAG
jgi:hypothetical protein